MKKILTYYHDGFYSKNPLKIISNLIRFRTFHHRTYNVGDQLSPIIINYMSNRLVRHAGPFQNKKLIAIGSILAGARDGDTIWGAGLKIPEHVEVLKRFNGKFNIKAVRGPDTRKVLLENNIDCPEVYGDPALLLPLFYNPSQTTQHKIGIIYHHHQENKIKSLDNEIVKVISPKDSWEKFINDICSCEIIISSSLHGVIISEAYGIPVVPMYDRVFPNNSSFKYYDYYHSTNRDPKFINSIELSKYTINDLKQVVNEIGKPKINLLPLIESFPYISQSRLKEITLKFKKSTLHEYS